MDQYFSFIFSQNVRLDPFHISWKFGAKILTKTGVIAKKVKIMVGCLPRFSVLHWSRKLIGIVCSWLFYIVVSSSYMSHNTVLLVINYYTFVMWVVLCVVCVYKFNILPLFGVFSILQWENRLILFAIFRLYTQYSWRWFKA